MPRSASLERIVSASRAPEKAMRPSPASTTTTNGTWRACKGTQGVHLAGGVQLVQLHVFVDLHTARSTGLSCSHGAHEAP
jgi:hypothetical protein